jgi:poly(A) polymerase/tRNA nucleotidyltransferase (CCA-adding enzyme)
MNLKIPSEVSRVTEGLQQAGFSAYLVGGCVRDLLLGLKPKDWDITTNATPEQITPLFPKTFYENKFGTVTVVNEETAEPSLKNVEVTPFRLEADYTDFRRPDTISWGQKIEDDLPRRDFTINALAYNPAKGQIIDLYGGQTDLKDKIIRTVGDASQRLTEDPLRMLRAIRFACQLGFVINNDATETILKLSSLLAKISTERIRDELVKIILSPEPMIGLVLCHKMALLSHIMPELEEGLHMKQNGDHIYDVWEHTLRVLQHSADKNYGLAVRLAALLHDIGKPRTRRWSDENKDWTFYGHDVVGAKMAKLILERLKFPVKTVANVVSLVRNHMFFSDVDQITLSAVRRIIVNVGREHIWELMSVRMCDRIGMGRPKESPYRLRKYESMIEEALRAPTSVAMLKIGGHDVLCETGIKPGPRIGQILHVLLEEVLEKPELNQFELLKKRSLELAKLDEITLKKLGESGKNKKAAVEEEALSKIRSRFHVK